MSRPVLVLLAVVLSWLTPRGDAADPRRITKVQIQTGREATYFLAEIEVSDATALLAPEPHFRGVGPPEGSKWRLARLPRLVPQDGKTRAVHYRLPLPTRPTSPARLVFLGKVTQVGPADLLLFYPVVNGEPDKESLAPSLSSWKWVEQPVTLDFGKAERLPGVDGRRPRRGEAAADDLEGRWAEAQARQFAVLGLLCGDFGYHALAREATERKYRVRVPDTVSGRSRSEQGELSRLYEMTTGATALAESLARERLLGRVSSKKTDRVQDVGGIEGITVPEHPWKKMMADRTPAPEPLAKLIPHDNYYIAFHTFGKFNETGDLFDSWGTVLTQAYELKGRDHDLRRRYEKQLCLRSTALGRLLGPTVIRGLALTGSDLYVREGSDVSVIFHVRNRALFLASVEPFLAEARKEFGKDLREAKSDYRGVSVESFVSPLREVSLHRASVSEFVIYSNSPVALRRILDTQAGRAKALADMLDFQYMRTVFRADDKEEDGFAFLSDAFIRRQVGPAGKIKEKRRLEALTSLYMVTHGALFCAEETGKLPSDTKALLEQAHLTADEVAVPEGEGVRWDGKRQVAVSDAYNTIHFATPLIELPIDKVTQQEQREYLRFRQNYLDNWRQYFDPVGVRLALKDAAVKMELYVLPLPDSGQYDFLRFLAGEGAVRLDGSFFTPSSLFQFATHLSPRCRNALDRFLEIGKPLGDWVFLRLEDDPAWTEWARVLIAEELGEFRGEAFRTALLRFPILFGVRIGNEKDLEKLLDVYSSFFGERGTSDDEVTFVRDRPQRRLYKGVEITAYPLDPACDFVKRLHPPGTPVEKRVVPGLYNAKVNGEWYFSTRLPSLRSAIDAALARKDARKPGKEQGDPVNSSVYIAPKAAVHAQAALRGYLEWQTHQRAVGNEPLWLALYRSGVLPPDATRETAEAAAWKWLGFVPVSPDGAAYRYEARTMTVANTRHGSLRYPRLHATLAEDSPVLRLLGQLQTIQANLRFREDGIHTVLAITRAPRK